jgi:hypothetical protein
MHSTKFPTNLNAVSSDHDACSRGMYSQGYDWTIGTSNIEKVGESNVDALDRMDGLFAFLLRRVAAAAVPG